MHESSYTAPSKMDVDKIFHMTGGLGENSYAKNSAYQKKASDMGKNITVEAIKAVHKELAPNSFGIADLGCSSGPNTLSTIKDLLETVLDKTNTKHINRNNQTPTTSEVRIYLNDLPTNDFNSVFKSLPDFYSALSTCCPCVFVAACPGSFYGRLFPTNSLHFVYSSYSLHWLSKVPPGIYDEEGKSINKGSVYINESNTNYKVVSEAYYKQFQEDFSQFLACRSQELVTGARMVLIFLGRIGEDHIDRGNYFFWKQFSNSLSILVSQRMISQEDLDSYDIHFYAASKKEIETEVEKEGSFEIEKLDMFNVDGDGDVDGEDVELSYGIRVAMTVRAIQESMISYHFGDGIVDTLFDIYGKLIDHEVAIQEIKAITFLLVLRKL